jgi:hypothetical protein
VGAAADGERLAPHHLTIEEESHPDELGALAEPPSTCSMVKLSRRGRALGLGGRRRARRGTVCGARRERRALLPAALRRPSALPAARTAPAGTPPRRGGPRSTDARSTRGAHSCATACGSARRTTRSRAPESSRPPRRASSARGCRNAARQTPGEDEGKAPVEAEAEGKRRPVCGWRRL